MNNKEENKDKCSDCPFNDTNCPGGMWCTVDDKQEIYIKNNKDYAYKRLQSRGQNFLRILPN